MLNLATDVPMRAQLATLEEVFREALLRNCSIVPQSQAMAGQPR